MSALIECVPNFSEGCNADVIAEIASAIRSVNGVKLLNIDPGKAANRTVMTFVGKSGTFFGEPGYDVETNIPMWPFPMEAIIKEKMGAYSYTGNTYTGTEHNRVVSGTGTIVGARGFAVEGQSLTNYIWGRTSNIHQC